MRKSLITPFGVLVAILIGAASETEAQMVRRIQPEKAANATAVWHGDTLYVSGQVPDPVKPAAGGAPAVYAPDTRTQSENVFRKIEGILKEQGLAMGDVVMMHVFLVGDPNMGGKMDFAGMMAAYTQYFGSASQPNK